jgi:hypothetical protein
MLERLVDRAPLSDELLQGIIISIRSSNGKRTWSEPHGVSRYQTIACAVQEPVKWESLSVDDRESLDDYIQYTLRYTLGSTASSDKTFAKLHQALDKIKNPAVRQDLEKYMEVHDMTLRAPVLCRCPY